MAFVSHIQENKIMDVIIDEMEFILAVAPMRLFRGFLLDTNTIVPKVVPFIKSFESVEGDGGVGTVKLVTYVEGDQIKTMKHKITEIDEANYMSTYVVLEGDVLDENIEFYSNTVKISPNSNEGCICKYINEFHTKGEIHQSAQEKIKKRKEASKAIVHGVEAYLLAHPHEYI